MHEVHARAVDLASDVHTVSETWGRHEVITANFTVTGYKLFRKDHADDIRCCGFIAMIKDTMLAVTHTLADFLINDILAPDTDAPVFHLTVICVFRHPHLIKMITQLFNYNLIGGCGLSNPR